MCNTDGFAICWSSRNHNDIHHQQPLEDCDTVLCCAAERFIHASLAVGNKRQLIELCVFYWHKAVSVIVNNFSRQLSSL